MTRSRRPAILVACAFALLFVVGGAVAAAATPSPTPSIVSGPVPFTEGDVFAGIGNGRWNHFDSSGTLLATLDDGHIGNIGGFTPAHATTGMCFDPAGNMYAMNFANNSMSKFDRQGTLLADSVGTFDTNPESCLVAGGTTIYTSQVTGSGNILKLDLAGTSQASYDVRRSDWIDLAGDGCTMLYSDEGPAIHRFDVCRDGAMTDFATAAGSEFFALRVLPDGTVLAAGSSSVMHFDASGAVIANYTAPGETKLFALNLDPDGASFWTGGLSGNTIYKFDIEPVGLPVLSFSPQVLAGGGTGLAGLAVFGEPIVAQATPTAPSATATPTETAAPTFSPAPTSSPAPTETAASSNLPAILLLLVVLLALAAIVIFFVLRRRRHSSTGA